MVKKILLGIVGLFVLVIIIGIIGAATGGGDRKPLR